MGQVGNNQDINLVMSSMSRESCRPIYRLNIVGVVICDSSVISLIAIGCGSSHRFHRKCILLQRKAAKSIPPEAHKVKSEIGVIHMSICSI